MIEKPFWLFGRVAGLMWTWARGTWHGVFRFLNRDATGLVIILVYAIGLAFLFSRWPVTRSWLGIRHVVDVALLAVFLLWALMLAVWMHEKVKEQILRWVPALMAMPAWIPAFLTLFVGLAIATFLVFGLSLALMPLGAAAMGVGLLCAWWRRRHGITLRCKHGECFSGHRSFRDVEVHYLCPGNCGMSYGFLIPSHHGLLYHHCTCGGKLPALKSLRRRPVSGGKTMEDSLKKECPQGHPWATGVTPLLSHFIAVAGGTSSGKTCFIAMALRELLSSTRSPYHNGGKFEDPADERVHLDHLDKLNHGVPLPETKPGDPPLAFVLRLLSSDRSQSRLYLYDAAGERYSTLEEEVVNNFVFFEDLTGIVLMVDPFNLPKLGDRVRDRDPVLWESLKVSRLEFENVVSALCKNISRWVRLGPGGRTAVPLAVAINKIDAAPEVAKKIGSGAKNDRQAEHDLCRQALIDWGAHREVEMLEACFQTTRYFSCSALGRTPDGTRHPFTAQDVLPPLLWLLESKGR